MKNTRWLNITGNFWNGDIMKKPRLVRIIEEFFKSNHG